MERVRAETTTVYSAHNVEYDFWRAQPNGAARTGVLRRLEELERRAVGASDLVITSTDADAARLRALHGGQPAYAVIANGFDESLFRLDRDGQRERARADLGIPPTETVLLFIGGPAAHNQAAVSFLERELMPQLGNGVTLLLAGESCGRSAGRRTDVHAVRRMGYVEDLSPLLAAADIGLNPVVTGSGSNLKVPAYLAAGLPVVTTPIGMRGFERLIEWLTVADLEDFAAAVRAPKPVPASARATLAEWSWTRLGQRLYRVLDDLLADVSPERRGQGGASRPPVPRSGADQARKP
jgi:glycosyltransferase involved in cell wall biosynthesis